MHAVPIEIPLPKNESDFEQMCAQIYGVVFEDPTPKINGRRGQAQGGVDVFVNAKGIGRVGVQCKKYYKTTLTWQHVLKEVESADKYRTPIKRLLVATTSPNDAALLHNAQLLSDERERKGNFTIEVEFWDDIQIRINSYATLQDSYAPHTPGAAYHRQEQSLTRLQEISLDTHKSVTDFVALSGARHDSANQIITAQLDRTNDLIKAGRIQDAQEHVVTIGKDLGAFDEHQRARWYLQRGLCIWLHGEDEEEAADLFIKASDIYPNDERMSAGRIRGLLLKGDLVAAVSEGASAIGRFPASNHVWLSFINARMAKGEIVSPEDVPSEMRESSEFLQLFAISAREKDNYAEAIALSGRAANHPDASFFTRATALRLVVENAALDPVAAGYGLLPGRCLEDLGRVINLFEPRYDKLWSVQVDAVVATATHLGFAYLLKHDFSGAVELAKEAAAHDIESNELLRIELQALLELNAADEVMKLGRARFADLTSESIVMVAELAARQGDVEFVDATIHEVQSWSTQRTETLELLSALRWTAFEASGRIGDALDEIATRNVAADGSLIVASAAARLLRNADLPLEADGCIERAKSLVDDGSTSADRLMLADLLFAAERWIEAASRYESLAPEGQLSQLHIRMLSCYVWSDSRTKARELLTRLPDGWIEDDQIRRLAITLGQNAGDWAFLRPLVETQVEKYPKRAESWLFKLYVARYAEKPAAFQDNVRQVPDALEGSIQNLSQLAALELRYDEQARALRRLYRLLRQNLDEPEAYSAYLINVLTSPAVLSCMEDHLPEVSAGSSVALADDTGHEVQVVIDPPDIGDLPKKDGFVSSDSSEAKALIGAEIGQAVTVPARTIGGTQSYVVTGIQSAYRRMIGVTQERARKFGGLPFLKSVPVGSTGDSAKDLSHMHEEIRRGSIASRQIFDSYGEGSLTLSMVAHMHGRSVIDIVVDWPAGAPPIFIGTGIAQAEDEARELLGNPESSYVTDALTLAEFVSFGLPEALGGLPRIIVSPATMLLIDQYSEDALEDRSNGVAVDIDGDLGFIQHDDEYKSRRIQFAHELIKAVNKYCIVQPTYGELPQNKKAQLLGEVLKDEEREMILLSLEHNANLLTLDGRLRLLAAYGTGIKGVWPQVLVRHCLAEGTIGPAKSSSFTVKEFLRNRSFVSVNSFDLVWMVMQGDSLLQRGIQTFVRRLRSAESDFQSTAYVALKFMNEIARLRTQLAAFGELVVRLVESILRHKDCPPDYSDVIARNLDALLLRAADPISACAAANITRDVRMRMQREYLAETLAEAKRRCREPLEARPLAVRVLYCSRIPWLVADKRVANPESDKDALSNGSADAADGDDEGSLKLSAAFPQEDRAT